MIHTHINLGSSDKPLGATVVISSSSWGDFQKLVSRAMNCWPDASIELKEFHDVVVHGGLLQNYARLENKEK